METERLNINEYKNMREGSKEIGSTWAMRKKKLEEEITELKASIRHGGKPQDKYLLAVSARKYCSMMSTRNNKAEATHKVRKEII